MSTNKEAIQLIETDNLNQLEVYKLIEKDHNLSKLFWFKGNKVKYSKEEYQSIVELIHNKK